MNEDDDGNDDDNEAPSVYRNMAAKVNRLVLDPLYCKRCHKFHLHTYSHLHGKLSHYFMQDCITIFQQPFNR